MYQQFGHFIRINRKTNKLSQTKLAKKLGYRTPQYISNIECGRCMFPRTRLLKLSKVLNIPKERLLSSYLSEYEKNLRKYLRISRG